MGAGQDASNRALYLRRDPSTKKWMRFRLFLFSLECYLKGIRSSNIYYSIF